MPMIRSSLVPSARRLALPAALFALIVSPIAGIGAPPIRRLEMTHPAGGHDAHVSALAVADSADGPLIAWAAKTADTNTVFVARPAIAGDPVRVNPPETSADSLHQAPGL